MSREREELGRVSAEYTGKRNVELRQVKGWTQKQLAERLNVTDKAVKIDTRSMVNQSKEWTDNIEQMELIWHK